MVLATLRHVPYSWSHKREQGSTKEGTEMTSCHYGDHEATNIKVEIERTYDEQGREITTEVRLPICKPCNEEYYDGTEDRPRLLKIG